MPKALLLSSGRRARLARVVPVASVRRGFSESVWERDLPIASEFDELLPTVPALAGPLVPVYDPGPLIEREDRRYLPEDRPIRRLSGAPARVQAIPLRTHPTKTQPAAFQGPSWALSHLMFQDPSRVLLCVRRTRRKEVIHAMGIAGSRVRKGRRGPYTSISCKER